MAQKLKIATTTSKRSVMGIMTFEKALRKRGIEVDRFTEEDLQSGGLPAEFDGALLHNTVSVSGESRRNSIVYALQTVVNKLTASSEIVDDLRRDPPREFWCNTQSAARKLTQMGFEARTMYRPAPRFTCPESYAPLPQEKRILWYYDPEHKFMKSKLDAIADLLERVDEDTEVLLFPSADCPVDRPNVKALGRIDLNEWLPKVRGMVRVSDHLDFGRSTFDVIAHGRWVLYYDMDEPITYSCDDLDAMPGRIAELLAAEDDASGARRFEQAKAFEIDALAETWEERLRHVFSSGAEAASPGTAERL